jgi:hypothetical protein
MAVTCLRHGYVAALEGMLDDVAPWRCQAATVGQQVAPFRSPSSQYGKSFQLRMRGMSFLPKTGADCPGVSACPVVGWMSEVFLRSPSRM